MNPWYSYAIPPSSSVHTTAARSLVLPQKPVDYLIVEDIEYVKDLGQFFAGIGSSIADRGMLVVTWRFWLLSWGFWRRVLPYARIDHISLRASAESYRYREVLCDIPIAGFFGSLFRLVPGIKWLYPWRYIVFMPERLRQDYSVTVVIPTKNERGTIEDAVRRLPLFGTQQEILFVDGHSTDGTGKEIMRVGDQYTDRAIRLITQTGRGKKNAVLEGIAAARGEIIILLDSDLAVAPEEMPLFYEALAAGRADLINGARFMYPMQPHATPRLNFVANLIFPRIIGHIIGQPIRDSLCGTKVFFKKEYEKLSKAPSVWGADPFGDFTFLFAWGRAWRKIIDVPVHHHARSYGATRIHRFSAGWILLGIVIRAAYSWTRVKKP